MGRVKRNVIVLNFFSRSCIPCLREMPTYNTIAEKLAGEAVTMLYVNVDPDITQQEVQRIIQRRKIQIPVMLPNQTEAVRKYDVISLPRIVVIDKKKKIAKIITGFDAHLGAKLTKTIQQLL